MGVLHGELGAVSIGESSLAFTSLVVTSLSHTRLRTCAWIPKNKQLMQKKKSDLESKLSKMVN